MARYRAGEDRYMRRGWTPMERSAVWRGYAAAERAAAGRERDEAARRGRGR